MRYNSKEIQLEDHRKLILRSCEKDDAQRFLDFFILVSSETENMIRYPEEITISVEQEKEILERYLMSSCQWMVGAFDQDRLVGNISFGSVNQRIKMRHRATFGITICKEYWHVGLGKILMKEMLNYLIHYQYEQVELEVLASNKNAIHLYEKMGFKECGRMPHGIRLKNGTYVDLISMVKFLNE